ncbi:hypothetical protein SAMN05444394_3568 [Algoriphagus halophilus]|uniref:Uncharacterized protein n=1 Tax=Algoriphagus halophilus TaxID=226505 RepID=A0A1N6H561_9BACT|nr:hypothetical protein SAMN05444394_3568 [Algoriphagus halophilus]
MTHFKTAQDTKKPGLSHIQPIKIEIVNDYEYKRIQACQLFMG